MIYDKNWQNLSLDWNGNPVMGWLTEAWEIRQVRVKDDWSLVIVSTNNPSATGAINSWQLKCTTGWTAVVFPTADIGQYVYIKANSNNTANISIWVSGVTTTANWSWNGCILEPWDFVYLTIDNLNKVYMNCANNTDFVSYILS